MEIVSINHYCVCSHYLLISNNIRIFYPSSLLIRATVIIKIFSIIFLGGAMHVYFNRIILATVFILSLMVIISCETTNNPSAPGEIANKDLGGSLNKGGVIHRVSVGGADICEALGLPTGCDANFSLVAIEKADGRISGQWQDTFSGGGEGIHVAVDCINVVGNGAVIGGVITHGTLFGVDVSGLRALTAVVDNGTSANDLPDQISFAFIDVNIDCSDLIPDDFQLIDLTHGQVKVR